MKIAVTLTAFIMLLQQMPVFAQRVIFISNSRWQTIEEGLLFFSNVLTSKYREQKNSNMLEITEAQYYAMESLKPLLGLLYEREHDKLMDLLCALDVVQIGKQLEHSIVLDIPELWHIASSVMSKRLKEKTWLQNWMDATSAQQTLDIPLSVQEKLSHQLLASNPLYQKFLKNITVPITAQFSKESAGDILKVRLNHDGSRMLCCTKDRFYIFDVKTGHCNKRKYAAVDSDTTSNEGIAEVYWAEDGEKVYILFSNGMYCAYSSDGSCAIRHTTAFMQEKGAVKQFFLKPDCSTYGVFFKNKIAVAGGMEWSWSIDKYTITNAAWNKASNKIAYTVDIGHGEMLTVSDCMTGDEYLSYNVMQGTSTVLCWSPDERYVAALCDGNCVELFQLPTMKWGKCLHTTNTWNSIAWSPNSMYLALGSEQGALEIWNVETEQPVLQMKFDESLMALDWSGDGKHLVLSFANGIVRIMDTCYFSPDIDTLYAALLCECYSKALVKGSDLKLLRSHPDLGKAYTELPRQLKAIMRENQIPDSRDAYKQCFSLLPPLVITMLWFWYEWYCVSRPCNV
jgi:WD40 repeat protein